MPTTDDLKKIVMDQQGMVNQLSKSSDPGSQKALAVIKPQYEQSLDLYTKALNKYKKK